MTWAELQDVARNAIQSELGATIPKTLAERVAKRIVEDVKIEFAKRTGGRPVSECVLLIADIPEPVTAVVHMFQPNGTPFIGGVKDGKPVLGVTNYEPEER